MRGRERDASSQAPVRAAASEREGIGTMAASDERTAPRPSDAQLRARLTWDDARLLAECEVDFHRVSGPGGQHRNKVETAVRITHRPSGLTVTGTERRSQHENKARALDRLREALAVYTRAPLPTPLAWPAGVQIQGGRLRVNPKNPAYYLVLGLALDALHAAATRPQDAAALLGVSTTSLVRFLADHPKGWAEAQRMRQAAGLSPLKA